jgi:hypothetical protein
MHCAYVGLDKRLGKGHLREHQDVQGGEGAHSATGAQNPALLAQIELTMLPLSRLPLRVHKMRDAAGHATERVETEKLDIDA